MHMTNIPFPPALAAKIVRCVEDAVGDDIRTAIQNHDGRIKNGVHGLIWDFLKNNISKELGNEECSIINAHRRRWEMPVVFEKSTQCILTFMREKRFSTLQSNQKKRNTMHYLDILTRQFNGDLIPGQEQLCIFQPTFTNEDRAAELAHSILRDFESDIEIVQNHVLVLFETVGYQLTRIRAVMVTPSLEIAKNGEQDWSAYISLDESTVVEKIENADSPSNQPNRNLRLTPKALLRQKNKLELKEAAEKKEASS